jgi:hypothetical protein
MTWLNLRIHTAGDSIYEKMVAAMGGKMASELNILGHARLLFNEAVVAFDAGASAATALECRASLEAACLGFLCREWNKGGYWGLDLPRTLDGKIRMVSFEELIAGVEKTRVLSIRNLNALRRVQRDGNLIAHFVSGRGEGSRPHIVSRRAWGTRRRESEAMGGTR